MDEQGRVPSFEALTRDQGTVTKSNTLHQGRTQGETGADDGQGLETSPSHRLEALGANTSAQESAKASDGHTMDQPLRRKRRRAGTACARCHRRKIKCSELPCRQCLSSQETCTPRPNAGSQKRKAIARPSLISGGENDLYRATEGTVLSGTSVEYTLPTSPPADITFAEERSGVIDYNNILPGLHGEEARGQMGNASTFISPCMSVDKLSGWPFQDAWDPMRLDTVSDFTGTLAEPDWGWDWPRAQHPAQNDNGSALQQPSPAPEQEVCSFQSDPEGSQSLDDTCAMFFCGEQPSVFEFLAMRGQYTAEGQHLPPPPTRLYPMSGFEWQDPTLEQPFESTDVPLPTKLSPTEYEHGASNTCIDYD
ncbi:hypothetical protein Asppvi_002004 [Aspergillus pseudoviridinutans]|uniref:Zn(2)-C6 fungal-type domain-containing protein n=1 Tax=Aspergillus pseudoviridinutans TaxID=1517512 RepID=A0A9P3EY71_9EURO|nr:uncharacterized protein Asppvi_002004 [Aspergillus pseudoviridinutans]GIJ92726.1 hypothetical protein Asppvi_002004 [Aspergillus pseudoviridinutans]